MSKLGIHALVPTADARRLVVAGASVALLVDDFGSAAEFLQINPHIIILGRIFTQLTAEAQYNSGLDPKIAANQFIELQVEKYALNPIIKVWLGHNEPVWDTLQGMIWYGLFEAERLRLLNELGLRGVVGNFSTGTPDITGFNNTPPLQWWEAFKPALVAAKQFNGYLGLHEYWTTNVREGYDDITGEGWNQFRYRKVHRLFLEPNGFGNLPIILTEFGSDFLKYSGYDYMADLVWADMELMKDDYLKGVALFTVGHNNEAWRLFDIAGSPIADKLVNYLESGIDTPPPDDEEEPPMTTELLVNPAFQSTQWGTDSEGNQRPLGWTYWVASVGELLPIPTKTQNHTETVPAICSARPENVHKLLEQLPIEERPGGARQLIFEGNDKVYKSFGNQGAIATKLSQRITVPLNSRVRFSAWVDLDTPDIAGAPDGKLEDDHATVRLTINGANADFNYKYFQTHVDPIKKRNWSLFIFERTIIGTIAVVELMLQKGWPGPTAFFLQDCSLTVITETPPIDPPAPSPFVLSVAEVAMLKEHWAAIGQLINRMNT